MDDSWEVLMWIWLALLFVVGLGFTFTHRRKEWEHLDTCYKTRKAMERMMNRD